MWFSLTMACVFGSLSSVEAPGKPIPSNLEVQPPRVSLSGGEASQRIIVLGVLQDRSQRDVSAQARFHSENPEIATVDAQGVIRPVADGMTSIKVRVETTEASVPVTVREAKVSSPVSFRRGVEPILTKLGCNQGACHGAQHGKGGFKLSLLGFEPEPDFTAIVKSAEGRRVTPFAPDDSLLLLKPMLTVGHGGGKKLQPDSREHQRLRLWLEQGAPGPIPNEPSITGLQVFPQHRTMQPGEDQRLVVVATYSDGTERDISDDARYDTLNEGVAKVDTTGLIKSVGQGETNVMVRYQGHAALARITTPYGDPKPFDFPIRSFVDEQAAKKWRELGLVPSDVCSDSAFLRRAMLDVIGTTPTPSEVDDFVADQAPDKRSKLVDRLLDRPEYVDYWTLKWGDLLRINSEKLGAQGMLAFNLWLRDAFRNNKPLSRMVEELVTAEGSIFTNGPANYFRVVNGPDDLAETTAQVFMGVRLQCAKCHHHPFEAYGQDDYYGLAAYFARIRTKGSREFGLFGGEQVIYVDQVGEVYQPRTGKMMPPTPLGAPSVDDPVDRRRALAHWLTNSQNPWLARNVANRYWGYLLGKGLVNPIDDLRETNPASNPELLNALSQDFVASGFDLKHLLRTILNSRVYQLSSHATPDNRLDTTYFTHYPAKRLTAEQLLDAINYATGTEEKFRKRPSGTRAISLPDTTYPSYFLDTFGRPLRAIACECERSADPNLSQALHLMNGDIVNRKVSQANGRLAKLLRDPKLTDETLVQMLYAVTFNRSASPSEIATGRQLITESSSRTAGAQDLFWGLLNSKEFLFNH